MKKRLLSAAFFVSTWGVYSQVGIGTLTPEASSQLDIVSHNKGVLLPRISLGSTTDTTTITQGNVNSLLVFNTNTQNDITPGYYYWYENKWRRVVNADDISALDKNTTNVSFAVENGNLLLTDSDGNNVSIPLSQINIPTTLVDNNDGTYTYTSENGTVTTINVPASVINNFEEIINNTEVLNQLIENLTNTTVGGNVYYDGNTFTYVDATGTTQVINFEDLVQANETVTTLVNNNNGTYTYTSENGTVTVIDIPSAVVENFETIVNEGPITVNGNTFNTVEEYIQHIANTSVNLGGSDFITVAGSGTTADPYVVSITEGAANTMLVTNAAGELEWATIESIVRGSETVTTLTDNNDGTYTYTSENGTVTTINVPASVINNFEEIINNTEVLNQLIENLTNTKVGGNVYYDGNTFTYVDATGTTQVINFEDLVQANETVTTLVNNNNGTYTYTSENGTVTVIDIPSAVVENFETIVNEGPITVNGNTFNTVEEYIQHIANTSVNLGGSDFITVAGSGTTADPYVVSITEGAANTMLVTNAAGELEWATIESIVRGSETVTTLTDNNDGTYTYTSENGTVTTINVPASVINNFEEIINNTEVLNQLIENLTNTKVGGNVYYDGNTFTYVDATGTTQVINFEDLVQANETVTTLVNNNNGTYTYTSENGTVTVIDIPSAVVENFETIVNEGPITVNGNTFNTVEEYIQHIANTSVNLGGSDFITVAGSGTTADPYVVSITEGAANTMLVTNAAGELEWATIESIVRGSETVTTLADNNNGTYTYTSENGTVTVIDIPSAVVKNFETIVNEGPITVNGNTFNTVEEYIQHIANTSVNLGGSDFITVAGSGTTADPYVVSITEGAANTMLVTNAAGELEWATIESIVRGSETVTTLADNNDGTYTYTSENGTVTTINVPASVINNFEEIINNTEVLNQLIENLTNTKVGGNVYYDGNTFTYVDATGTTQVINFEDLVQNNQKTVTLVQGTNTTVNSEVTGNNTEYKVNVATASGTTLGVVKEAATDSTVNIAADGSLSVNIANVATTQGKDLTSESITVTNGEQAVLKDVKLEIKPGTNAGEVLATVDENGTLTTGWIAVTNAVEVENGLEKNTEGDKIHLGGTLIKPTEIGTDDENTLAITGLEPAAVPNSIVVVEDNEDGILRTVQRVENYNASGTTFDLAAQSRYSVYIQEITVMVTIGATDMNITLPSAANANGQVINIKIANTTEPDAYVNIANVDGTTIYGSLPYQGWIIKSDGASWKVVGRN